MNTTELRDELGARVASIDAPPSMATAVAAKIWATKRRRAATVAGAACAVAVLTGVSVVNAGRSTAPVIPAGRVTPSVMVAADGMPYRAVPPSPGDVARDGLRYRAQAANDRLAVATIGKVGQNQVSMTWTPTTTNVSLDAACWMPGRPAQAERRMVWLVVGGKRVMGGSCQSALPDDGVLPTGGSVPGEAGQGWSALTVGRPITASIEVVDRDTNRAVTDPGMRVTGAVYDLGARRLVSDPRTGKPVAALAELIEHQGHRYRLEGDVATSPASSARTVNAATPGDVAFFVTFGSAGTGPVKSNTSRGIGTDVLSGLNGSQIPTANIGVLVTAPQPARAVHSVTLHRQGPLPERGVALIAIYTLAD